MPGMKLHEAFSIGLTIGLWVGQLYLLDRKVKVLMLERWDLDGALHLLIWPETWIAN